MSDRKADKYATVPPSSRRCGSLKRRKDAKGRRGQLTENGMNEASVRELTYDEKDGKYKTG